MKHHTQLSLSLIPPSKIPRNKLTPAQKQSKYEKKQAHRLFKLLKSNRYNHFSEDDKQLLKKHYNINL